MLSDFYRDDGGKRIYNWVLNQYGRKKIGERKQMVRVSNPFYEDRNPDLKIYYSGNMWRHHDFGAEEYSGNCIDFAALHFDLDPANKDEREKLSECIAAEIFNNEAVERKQTNEKAEQPRQRKFGKWHAGEVGQSALDEFMQAHGNNWPEVCEAYGVHSRGNEIVLQVACPARKVRTIQLTKYRIDGGKLTKKNAAGKAMTHACESLKQDYIEWVLFGAHLITKRTQRVCVVEAQDTALLCAMKYPAANTVWTASVGKNTKKHRAFMLQHRTITWRFYPDVDAVDDWRDECKYLQLHGLQCELMRWHTAVDWSGAEHLNIDKSHADLKDWLTLESLKG